MNKVVALAVSDLKITARRGEAVILNLVVPTIVLIALAQTSAGIEKALPFAYLQVVLATSMVSLGIMTGFDRRFRVLVRLGTTPLGRKGLVYSKNFSMLVIQTFGIFVLTIVGVALGWQFDSKWLLAIPLCWIASFAFAGIALLVAGCVKAEANLGIQNLLYLVMMGVAGIVFAGSKLSGTLQFIIEIIPSGALHTLLRYLAGVGDFSWVAMVSLVAFSVVLPLLAARKFTFDES